MRYWMLAVLLAVAGCGGGLDWDIINSDRCKGGPDLVVSNLTPAELVLQSNTGFKELDFSVMIKGTHCENLRGENIIDIGGTAWKVTYTIPSAGDSYTLAIPNNPIDTSYFSASTGTLSFMVSTATRSSNKVFSKIIIQ